MSRAPDHHPTVCAVAPTRIILSATNIFFIFFFFFISLPFFFWFVCLFFSCFYLLRIILPARIVFICFSFLIFSSFFVCSFRLFILFAFPPKTPWLLLWKMMGSKNEKSNYRFGLRASKVSYFSLTHCLIEPTTMFILVFYYFIYFIVFS